MPTRSFASLGIALLVSIWAGPAAAQTWWQHDISVAPVCGSAGTIFDYTLEYELSEDERDCMVACDTNAYIDLWDYNPIGSDTLLCSWLVTVSSDDGSGDCSVPVLYGAGEISCDLSAFYGGLEGTELELYYVMETEIPSGCANPYFASGTQPVVDCTPPIPGPTQTVARFDCSGTHCATTPAPLPNDASGSIIFDPCSGGAFTFTASGDLEAGMDRVCAGGTASAGPSGSCSAGQELSGSGPWSGSASGPMLFTIASDSSVQSAGITSLDAVCPSSNPPAPPPASIRCGGAQCTSTPTPLPHDASASTRWDPCQGAAFDWSANGELEDGLDRGCVGGDASAGASGACSAGDTLSGQGPFMGHASGPVTLSVATDSSVESLGFTIQATACGTSGAPPPPPAPMTAMGIDLAASLAEASEMGRPGAAISMLYSIENRGPSAAPAHVDLLRLESDDRSLIGYDLCRDRVAGMPAGNSAPRHLECPVPRSVEPGLYRLVLAIDADDLVSELDESNNQLSRAIRILAPEASGSADPLDPQADGGGCVCRRGPVSRSNLGLSLLVVMFSAGVALLRRR